MPLATQVPAEPGPGLERATAYVRGCIARGGIAGAVMLVSRHDQVEQLACIG